MEREMRMRVFVEEYTRLVQLFEDIVTMRQSMARLEMYMLVMVGQVSIAILGGLLILMCQAACKWRNRGEYRLEHRFERDPVSLTPKAEKKHLSA